VVLAKLAPVLDLTGLSTDYLTELSQRPYSFKEFMEEWIIDQFLRTLDEIRPEETVVTGIFSKTSSRSTTTDLCERLYLSRDVVVRLRGAESSRAEVAAQ